MNLDYTSQGRRPSATQIVADWKKAGRPGYFAVEYGETFAAFQLLGYGRWTGYGNGCRGADGGAVIKALAAAGEQA